MSSESPGPAVQIQFDHLESELIFQQSEGETEEFSVATPPEWAFKLEI